MFGVSYQKSAPTTYVALYKEGKIVREGTGLSFFYFAPTSEMVLVPLSSAGVPFVFNEATADFQEVTIQGEFTYRVTDPKKLSSVLNYSVDQAGRYRSEDPLKLAERLTHVTQKFARSFLQQRKLREVLTSADTLVTELSGQLKTSEAVAALGVEIMDLAVLGIKPTPEMNKALQAEAREGLLRTADEAIYERRNNSVLLERTIKENELKTELVVQQKQQEVEEARLASEITLEQTRLNADIARETERAKLVEQSTQNQRLEADARGYALKANLEPLHGMDWRMLMAMGQGEDHAKSVIAMAFQELASNAHKIKELTITPDLLNSLLKREE